MTTIKKPQSPPQLILVKRNRIRISRPSSRQHRSRVIVPTVAPQVKKAVAPLERRTAPENNLKRSAYRNEKELIVTGKSIDEAMASAAEQLGERMNENIEYEILEFPKKGILGIGSSPAKIKVIYTIPDEDPALELVNMLIRSIGP